MQIAWIHGIHPSNGVKAEATGYVFIECDRLYTFKHKCRTFYELLQEAFIRLLKHAASKAGPLDIRTCHQSLVTKANLALCLPSNSRLMWLPKTEFPKAIPGCRFPKKSLTPRQEAANANFLQQKILVVLAYQDECRGVLQQKVLGQDPSQFLVERFEVSLARLKRCSLVREGEGGIFFITEGGKSFLNEIPTPRCSNV